MTTTARLILFALLSGAAIAGAQTLGKGGSLATGGAGPDGAQGANAQLERCDAPKGTLAVVEPQRQVGAEPAALRARLADRR